MGVDAGFDLVPRLTKKVPDRQEWSCFIAKVEEMYEGDQQVEVKPHYLLFKAGEHPKLPYEGHKFLRFSSKISGRIAASTNVEQYIRTVMRIARDHFGSRVRAWSEYADQYGHYDWAEVNESISSYEKTDEDETPTSMPGPQSSMNATEDSQSQLYEIRSTPGRGRGLFARRDLPEGSRILAEPPLLMARSLPPEFLEPILAAKLRSLSREEQREFFSLHNNHPGGHPFSGIVRTNALPCGPDSEIGAVYATICFINHSCLPNAHNNWNPDSEQETIHAIRPIPSGEEITISYSKGEPSATRLAKLRQSFGFDCACPACSLPPEELVASDVRRLEIQRLDDAIGNPLRMMRSPSASIADCELLVGLLREEYGSGAGVLCARAYYDALQISIAHGDQARAAVFAECAYKARVLCEGEDSPQTRRMIDLMRDPKSHPSFAACSRRWGSQRSAVPDGLSGDELERWVWGRATKRQK